MTASAIALEPQCGSKVALPASASAMPPKLSCRELIAPDETSKDGYLDGKRDVTAENIKIRIKSATWNNDRVGSILKVRCLTRLCKCRYNAFKLYTRKRNALRNPIHYCARPIEACNLEDICTAPGAGVLGVRCLYSYRTLSLSATRLLIEYLVKKCPAELALALRGSKGWSR